MKKNDFLLITILTLIALAFVFIPQLGEFYNTSNANSPLIMAFVKFAILATFGEVLGLRIKTGNYTAPNFGMMPRMVLWGLFGVWIAVAMGVFRSGVPLYLSKFEAMSSIADAMNGVQFTGMKLLGAFGVSVMMNTCFAPVFMTLHKITDTHIANCGGSLKALITPIPLSQISTQLNWNVQWNFVFKKTIPFFWIPAHTITFILPVQYQVLFAALLGVALGLILSIAALKSK